MANLCIDCKHHQPLTIGTATFHECARPVGVSAVDGGPELHRWKSCGIQRQDGGLFQFMFKTCGKRGRFFQSK